MWCESDSQEDVCSVEAYDVSDRNGNVLVDIKCFTLTQIKYTMKKQNKATQIIFTVVVQHVIGVKVFVQMRWMRVSHSLRIMLSAGGANSNVS